VVQWLVLQSVYGTNRGIVYGVNSPLYEWFTHCVNRPWYGLNGAQRYEQFLQVGRLYRALILLSLALFQAPLCLRSSWCYICIKKCFCLHPSLYLLVSWACRDWPLTSLTNHRPSVQWHCWLGHLTRKIVSEMIYNVSSGTLNTTILLYLVWIG